MIKSKPLVLIVDDDPRITEGLSRRLRSEDYVIATASSGSEAMPLVKSRAVAVIVCDETMPFQSGISLLMAIKEISPKTVRIMLTGAPSVSLTLRAINSAGVFRFMTKPCDTNELRKVIVEGIKVCANLNVSSILSDHLTPKSPAKVHYLEDNSIKQSEGS